MAKDLERKVEELEARIRELESEVEERESDIARFRNELVNANQQIETLITQISQELKLAAQVQKVLAPTEYPNIRGVEFSTKFIPGQRSGGDYFDIFEHQDKFRFGILVACSTGYTMSALFMSVLLKFTGRMEARKGGSASEIVRLIAEDLCPNIPEGNTASLFYAVMDRRSFSINCCNIGAIPAVLQSGNDRKLTPIKPMAPAFSRGFHSEITDETHYLQPKDRLIVCTEGLTNTQSPSGEKFGLDRLYRCILAAPAQGVHALRNEILFQNESFRGAKASPMDLTVVVTEVQERVLKLAKGPAQ